MSDTVPLLQTQDIDDEEEFLLVDNPALAIKVTNLPVDFPNIESELKEFFSFCGHITHLTVYAVLTSSTHPSRAGSEATLVFQHPDAAKSAVLLTGTTLGEQKINVETVPALPAHEELESSRISAPKADETPKTQTSVVEALLAKGYQLAETAVQQAKAYDEQYHVSATAQALVQQLDEKTKEFEKEYNLSEVTQATFENIGHKIQEVEEQYHIGASLNQALAAVVTTGELARDVIVARTSETAANVQSSTADVRSQGEAITMTALASAAEAIESLQIQERTEAVVNSIQNFVENNETAQATWNSLQQWATGLQAQINGTAPSPQ